MQASFDCLRVIQNWQRKYCTPGPYPKDEAQPSRIRMRRTAKVGEVYGGYTILEDLGVFRTPAGQIRQRVRVRCECGKVKVMQSQTLLRSNGKGTWCVDCVNKRQRSKAKCPPLHS